MKRKIVVLVLLCVVVFITGCKTPGEEAKIYDKPLPPGEYALRKLTNAEDIPEFIIACYELDNLRTAVAGSLNYLKKPSSRDFFHAVKLHISAPLPVSMRSLSFLIRD